MADQSSTLKVEDLEKGKRYRISFDGEWTGYAIETGKTGPAFSEGWFTDTASSIEKLPDPEPQWRDGAVVRFRSNVKPLVFNELTRKFHWPNGQATVLFEGYWRDGQVEILYQPK